MKQELQLKLQAYLDGELPEGEAREVAGLLAQDAEARALLAELKNTRAALAGFEADIKLPESRVLLVEDRARNRTTVSEDRTGTQVCISLRLLSADIGAGRRGRGFGNGRIGREQARGFQWPAWAGGEGGVC